MALPAPEDATKWYELACTIIEGIVAPEVRSRKRRYQQLKALYDLISDVYICYAEMFADFERELPSKNEHGEGFYYRADIIEASQVPSIVKQAKEYFNVAREELSTERQLWKSKAAGWFQAAVDRREQHFLFAAF